MKKFTIGYYSSLAQSLVGYSYLIVYIAFIVIFPVKPWVNIHQFALQYHGLYKTLLTIIQILAFMQAFLYLIIASIINNSISGSKKIISNISVLMSVIFFTFSSLHYYIQWTTVRLGIENKIFTGLEHLSQFNFDSPVSVINILGWTIIFGISNIALAYCFNSTKTAKWLKYGFLVNGFISLLTGILFAFGIKSVMFIWTIILALTWYVYPILFKVFKEDKLNNIL